MFLLSFVLSVFPKERYALDRPTGNCLVYRFWISIPTRWAHFPDDAWLVTIVISGTGSAPSLIRIKKLKLWRRRRKIWGQCR